MMTGRGITNVLTIAVAGLVLALVPAAQALEGQLGILDEAWFAANPINPGTGAQWKGGDTYHLAFATVATVIQNTGGPGQLSTDQQWADIANWDAVVQAEGDTVGEGAGADVTWKVIGSTATVDARDHTAVSGPVYTCLGIALATGYADMWDGEVANEITHIDGTSVTHPTSYAGLVWTGTYDDGTKTPDPLGSTDRYVSMGDPIANSGPVGSDWIDYGLYRNQDHWRPASVYGISEVLEVVGARGTVLIVR